jgi:hypothetical protein
MVVASELLKKSEKKNVGKEDSYINPFSPKDNNATIQLWYPHYEVGNKPNIVSDNVLEKYGCYHFKIYYFPEPINSDSFLNQFKEDSTKATTSLAEKGIQIASGGIDLVYNALKTSVEILTATIAGSTSESSPLSGIKNPDRALTSPVYSYKNLTPTIAEIHLPLSSMDISRASGVGSGTVTKDIITTGIKHLYDKFTGAENLISKATKSIVQKTGNEMRDFVSPTVGQVELDKQTLSWEFVPRSQKEMEHINMIIRFFVSLSVPNFEKSSFFYTIPPVLIMRAISTDFNKTLFKDAMDKDDNLRILKPYRQYYLTNIKVDTSTTAEGSVLLSTDGYPMFIKLEITLMKADISTHQELFNYPFM